MDHVDLPEYHFPPLCTMDGCGKPADVIAQGCMDKEGVALCQGCLEIGMRRIALFVSMYQRLKKRVLICDDCHRPVLHLETHLDVRTL